MKKLFFIFLSVICISLAGQTVSLSASQDLGSIKIWSMQSNGTILGKVYSIERASCSLKFAPEKEQIVGATLVMAGTYTSTNGNVAGNAFDLNCNQIGNPKDALFKPNAYLVFDEMSVENPMSFSTNKKCNSIQVYQLIDDGTILSDIINARTKQSNQWRFLVQKSWTKTFTNASLLGTDWMIIDFEKSMTLSEACIYIKQLERSEKYDSFMLNTTISACLLDTGKYRPFLLNGSCVHGQFPTDQSNLIIVR